MPIHALETQEELHEFIEFGHQAHRANPSWVPPDVHHLMGQLGNEGPSAASAEAQAFWVTDGGGDVLATVAAVVHRAFNEHGNESIGHLLFFEALPAAEEAAVTLIRAASDWLRGKGCTAARMSFLPGWQLPLSIDAFDQVPTLFHTYTPSYYHRIIKNAGFVTERGLVEYRMDFTPELAGAYRRLVERTADSGITLRAWDFARLESETGVFADLFNDTFAAHWGMPTFTFDELAGLTVGLKDFLVPEFTGFAEADGRPVGFVYSLPDLNRAFHAFRGRDPAAHADEFQQSLAKIDHGMLLIIGVKDGYRGRGINLALAARSYLAMIDRGYKSASYTVVLDDNWPSRRTAEKLGGRVWRNYIFYRRELPGIGRSDSLAVG